MSKKNVGKDADVAAWKATLQGEIHFRLAEGVIRCGGKPDWPRINTDKTVLCQSGRSAEVDATLHPVERSSRSVRVQEKAGGSARRGFPPAEGPFQASGDG